LKNVENKTTKHIFQLVSLLATVCVTTWQAQSKVRFSAKLVI